MFKKGHKHSEETKRKIGEKSKEFWTRPEYITKNKIPREKRECICGCKKYYECRIDSKQKFIRGHNNKNKDYSNYEGFKKGHGWNKGLTKEVDVRILNGSIKKSLTEKGKHSGNLSNFWKGGITPLTNIIRSLEEYKEWRIKVFKRDNYTCQECGENNCYIEAHHVYRFSKIFKKFLKQYNIFSPIEDKETLIKLAINYESFWDINNGQTLCLDCHNKTKGRYKNVA